MSNIERKKAISRMKKYAPEQYNAFEWLYPSKQESYLSFGIIVCMFFMIFTVMYNTTFLWVLTITAYLFTGYVATDILKSRKYIQDDILDTYLEWEVENQPSQGEIMSSIKENSNQTINIGDVTLNGNNNPLIIGSRSIRLLQEKEVSDPDLASSLAKVADHIQETNNKEAGVLFDKFTEQLNTKKPDKTILKSLWDSMLSVAPAIKSLADATAAVTKLF